MIYLQLFLSFLTIGAFSFGGGYAAMPLIQNQVITLRGWLTPAEFTDLVTISQMTPGPIAINAAAFVGARVAGIPGAAAATAGCILPSCILVSLLARLYLKYKNLRVMQNVLASLRPCVAALIAAAGVSILVTSFWGTQAVSLHISTLNLRAVFLFLGALLLLMRFKVNPILVMVLCGAAETMLQLTMQHHL